VIRESIEIPPHLSLSACSIPVALFVHGYRAVGHRENETNAVKEGYMCPVCIASTAAVVAGVGSTGGILAESIGRFKNFFRTNRTDQIQKTEEK
jgi:hypothetical protein